MTCFTINADFVKVMSALKDGERGRLWTAMCNYALTGEDAELFGNERVLYPAAKMMIDACNAESREKDKESTKEKEKEKARSYREPFNPPTLEDVKKRISDMGYTHVNAEAFIAHYQSVGWKVGKNKMESWHAALAGWETRHKDEPQRQGRKNPALSYKQTPISQTDFEAMTVDLTEV